MIALPWICFLHLVCLLGCSYLLTATNSFTISNSSRLCLAELLKKFINLLFKHKYVSTSTISTIPSLVKEIQSLTAKEFSHIFCKTIYCRNSLEKIKDLKSYVGKLFVEFSFRSSTVWKQFCSIFYSFRRSKLYFCFYFICKIVIFEGNRNCSSILAGIEDFIRMIKQTYHKGIRNKKETIHDKKVGNKNIYCPKVVILKYKNDKKNWLFIFLSRTLRILHCSKKIKAFKNELS